MADPDLSATAQGPQPISMKVIMQRSGVSRQTIHFYLRKGLLPKPRRTSRTYALYSPETLDLLAIIKECQSTMRLSLDEIVKIAVRANYDPGQIRKELERRKITSRATPQAGSAGSPNLTGEELLATFQPPPPMRWLEELRQRHLVDAREKYSAESAELIRSIWHLCQSGAQLDDLQRLVTHVDVEAEARLTEFRRTVHSSGGPRSYAAASRLLAASDRFVLCKRKEAMRSAFFDKVFRPAERVAGPNRKRVIPSETFLVKMGLNREIDRLLNLLDRNPTDMRSLKDLARAYHMRSDWLALSGVNEKILQIDPLDVRATADQTRAMYYLGRIDDAIALLEQRVRTNGDPLLKFRLGQSLVLRARNEGVSELFSAVIRREMLTAEALREARDQPSVRRWILLDRALDNLSISDPLRLNQPTIEELEALYDEYQSISEKNLAPLSRMGLVIGRTLAAYALYLVYSRHQHSKAEQLRRKIVQMDPQCVLAGRPAHTPETRPSPSKSKLSSAGSRRISRISLKEAI